TGSFLLSRSLRWAGNESPEGELYGTRRLTPSRATRLLAPFRRPDLPPPLSIARFWAQKATVNFSCMPGGPFVSIIAGIRISDAEDHHRRHHFQAPHGPGRRDRLRIAGVAGRAGHRIPVRPANRRIRRQ